MKEKKSAMVITIGCKNKDEVKKVLNIFKDAIAANLPGLTEDDADESEPKVFQPNAGDICTYIDCDEPAAIFLFNGKEHVNEDGIRMLESELSMEYSGNLLQPYIVIRGEGQEVPADDCRLATQQEAALFHEHVKSTDRKDEDWVPRKGDAYWTPSFDYDYGEFKPVKTSWEGKSMEVYTHKRRWTFRSEEKCRKLCDKLNEAIKNVNL